MQFCHRVPASPLDSFIESIWVYQNDPCPHALERVMPTGTAQLIVNLKEDQTRLYDPESPYRCVSTSGSVLSGVHTRFQVIDTSEQEYVAGVAFKPGGTVPFFRVPAHEASDSDVPLESLWGSRRAATLRERLLECRTIEAALDAFEAVLREMWRPPGPHPAVAYALAAFDRTPSTTSVARVTDTIGLSAKRFIERFNREVGVTPKRYCRIRRFQRALALSHHDRRVDWTRVAMDCGYFDQAHFIHDFRSFAGITPTLYHSVRTSFQNHVKFLQSASDGF
ncbi:MAG: AraC family transcriptional regulator [Vicinamibacterales bacterium]